MINCPICENKQGELIIDSFLPKYRQCKICGGSFTTYDEKDIYGEEYFSEKTKPPLISRLVLPLFDFFYYLRIKKIKNLFKNNSNPKILDYGCGSGKLVEKLLKQNINIVGFEPSESAGIIAHGKNLPVYDKINPPAGGYDLVMFWHSLEHTPNPLEVLVKVRDYLNENGKLLIAIPNAGSFEAKIFKENWFHYDYPFHLIQFTPETLEIMFSKSGLKIVKFNYFNPEYTISGLIQSFLNWFLPKDALYSITSHRRLSMPSGKAAFLTLASTVLLALFFPLIILFFLFELIFRKTGAMLVIVKHV